MLRATLVCLLVAVLGASSPSHAREACIYNVDKAEKPYYVLGSLVTPQANIQGVAECGMTADEVNAALDASTSMIVEAGAGAASATAGAAGSPAGYATPTAQQPQCAENGSCYGDISAATGRPKTVNVQGYYRKDGTYLRGYYRSAPRRH